jgi:hypothetical protein
MSEMQKRKLYRVVLPPGSGAWTVKLLPRAKVRNLEGTLRSLVAALNAKQRTALSINDCSDEEQLKVEHPLRRAGIEFLRKDADLRDLAFVHLPGVAGTMSDGGALIRSWLGEVFEVHSGKLSLKTLEDADVAEKHFFVWIGDNSPAQLQMTALLDPESPPKDEPSLPDWVTHIWLGVPASSSEDRFLWHHTKPRGWQVVRFDAMCRSKPN